MLVFLIRLKKKKHDLENTPTTLTKKGENPHITIITADHRDIKSIIRKCYKKFSTHIFGNLDRINQFLERQKQKLTQEKKKGMT